MRLTMPITPQTPKERFLHSVRTLSLSKNKFWIKSMVMRDKIQVLAHKSEEKKRAYLRTMFKFIDILNDTYGDDWDMHVQSTLGSTFMLTPMIRYRDLTITNTPGNSRNLKDLIVAVPFNIFHEDIITIEDKEYMRVAPFTPRGLRMSLYPDEYVSHYHHSHLPRKNTSHMNIGDTYEFCVGDGDIVDAMSNMATGNSFDPGYFAFFLSVLDVMVRWESIEGTPYIRMATISSSRSRPSMVQESMYPSVMESMKTQFIGNNFRPTLLLHKNRFKIAQNEYIERYVHSVLKNSGQHGLLVKKSTAGFVPYGTESGSVSTQTVLSGNPSPYIMFSGEKLEFSMINTNDDNRENIRDYKVHPQFLNHVTNELEKLLLKASIRDNLIRSEYRIVNTQRGNAQDTVPV